MREPSLFDQLEDLHNADWVPDEPPQIASRGVKDIILNFETNGLRWWAGDVPISVAVRLPDGTIRFLPWGHRGGNLDEATMKRWATRELRDVHITNINTRFDVHQAYAWGVDLEAQGCTVSDVSHYAALLDDHRKTFSLDSLAEDYLGGFRVPRVDESRMADYHASQVAPRARHQVELVHELREVFWPKLDEQDLQRVRQLEDDVIYPVCEMERNGAPIDVELLDRWLVASQKEYEQLLWQLVKEVGFQVDPNRPEHRQRLWQHLKLPLQYLPSGRPSFTDAIVAQVEHPVVELMRKAAKLSSLRSKFLVNTRKHVGSDGILRYALHQLRGVKDEVDQGYGAGTVTGRFSSTALAPGEGINIQQRIKGEKQRLAFGYAEDDTSHDDEIFLVRKLHRPGSGLFLSADMMQVEYRLFSHYANNQKIIEAYEQNPLMSFHRYMHARLKAFKPDLTYRRAKDISFGKIYGAGTVKLALMFEFITQAESEEIRSRKQYDHPKLAPAKEILEIYNREIPEVAELLKHASDTADKRGYVKTLLGRRFRFPDKQRLHKALNGVIQGGAADVMKQKLVQLHAERKQTGFKLRYTIHDEVDGDIPDLESAHRVAAILNRQPAEKLRIPLLWEVSTGPNWGALKGLDLTESLKGLI